MADADREDKKMKVRAPRPQKKRPRNPEEWHKQKQKRLRIAGKAHVNTNGKIVPEKKPGPDCRCRRRCFEKIPESVRLKTFEGFYAMRTHDEQNAYLFGLMRQIDIKRKRRKDSSRRTCTFEYFIRVRGRETQVCQTAFKNIHAITERKVRVLCKKMDDGIMFPSDNRGKNNGGRAGIVRLPQDTINQIKTHIYTIVHTHRLKDFIRVDKGKGLEINISKMWKDYIKTYDPTYVFATHSKTKKKESPAKESVRQPQIVQNPLPQQEMPGPSADGYTLTYPSSGGLMNLTEGYITQTMVPGQYPAQHVTMTNYILPDKMTYFPDGQVVVESGNLQQLIQGSNSISAALPGQQQAFTGKSEGGAYLIVHPVERPQTSKPLEDHEQMEKSKDKKVKKGPSVKQWRYTSIFHDEFNGVALAAIKTRLPLYYSEKYSPKKKAAAAKGQPKDDQRMQIQPQCHQQFCHQHQCQQPQTCQMQHCQPHQCHQQPCQQQECQQQQQQQQHQQQQHHHQQQQQQQQHCQQQQTQTQQTIIAPIPCNIFNAFSTDKM